MIYGHVPCMGGPPMGGRGMEPQPPGTPASWDSDRLAKQIITDRGFDKIRLPTWGRTLDWRLFKKKKKIENCFFVWWWC